MTSRRSFLARLAAFAAVCALAPLTNASSSEIVPRGTVLDFQVHPAPKPAQDIRWRDPTGFERALSDFKGKLVVLNFWATWCAPCITELPSLMRLGEKTQATAVVVIALNIDRGETGAEKARAMLRRLKLDSLGFHHDTDSKVYRALGIEVMPTTIVFGTDGREVGRLRGPAEWDAPEALSLLQALLDSSKP